MIYKVQARFNQSKSKEFYELLTGNSLEDQVPDGPEILASMKRATVDSSGLVRWTELCFCSTPLKHERATVYDKYLSEIQTEKTDSYEKYEGESFMEHISKF